MENTRRLRKKRGVFESTLSQNNTLVLAILGTVSIMRGSRPLVWAGNASRESNIKLAYIKNN